MRRGWVKATGLTAAFAALLWLVSGAGTALGQIDEPINLVRGPMGVGARALGLGGAYSSVANDYTALYWNPAGLATIRKMELNVALSHTRHKDDATMGGNATTDEMTRTRLNTLGFVVPVPTYRGSLVFAVGYHRPKTFDGSFSFEWFNPTSDDMVQQRWNEFEEGYLSVWSAGGAIDLSPNLSVGASLNFWGGNNDYQWAFREFDTDNRYTFDTYLSEDYINTDVKATELKGGALFRMGRILRFSATVSAPKTFRYSEDWGTNTKLTYDDGGVSDSTDSGTSDYELTFPMAFGAGASLHLLNILLTGDVEYTDWSQVKFKTDPPVADYTRTEANLIIHDRYRATTNVRLGAEVTLPFTGIQLRGGVAVRPSPLRGASAKDAQKFYSLGLGVLLDKQLKMDVAWVRGNWKRHTASLTESTDVHDLNESIRRDLFMVTLAFRF